MAQDPDAIQREIDRTRQELAQTLDAIADKVSPRKHLDRGKARAKDALEQGKAKALETGESVRQQVEARRNGTTGSGASGSGGLQAQQGGPGQLYYSSGRELRTDRVAMAGAALVAVLAYLVRRRRRA